MSKKIYFCAVAVILAVNYNLLAAISESDKAVFKKHATLSKAQSQINRKSSLIFNNFRYQLEKYASSIKALKSGRSPDINRSINNLERQKKYAINSLKSGEKNLESLKKKIDSIKIDKVRQVEVDSLYAEQNKLKFQINKLRQPYTKEKAKYMAQFDVNTEKSKLKALISPLIKKIPGLVSKIKAHVFYENFYVNCSLYKNNKSIGWMNIRVRPVDKAPKKEKLAGKYTIYSLFRSNIHFNVKDFQIAFQINSIKDKERTKKIAPQLIDLAGLEKASDQKVIQKWLAACKFSQKVNNKLKAATEKLNSKSFKIRLKINKLSREGFKTSAEKKRLNTAYLHAKSSYKNNKETIATASFLIKQLKSPITERKNAIQTITKKAAGLKNKILNYATTVNKQKALLAKDINFSETNKKYQILVNNFFILPQSKTFALANRINIDAWLGSPQIKCTWEQDLSTAQYPRLNSIFVGKINYRPDYILSNSKGMVDNKYPIIDNNYGLNLRVGDFNVSIYSARRNFYGKETNIKAIKELFDLDAIANITK